MGKSRKKSGKPSIGGFLGTGVLGSAISGASKAVAKGGKDYRGYMKGRMKEGARTASEFQKGMDSGRRKGARMAGSVFGTLMGASPMGVLGGMLRGGGSRRPKDGRSPWDQGGPWGGGRSSEPYPRGPRGGGGGQRGQWVNKETGDAWLSKGRGDYAPGRRAGQGDKPEDWADDPRLDKYTFKPTYRN